MDKFDMPVFISLLRGINVSGQKQIKMDQLKSVYESLGFTRVATYIQSGNVVFDSKAAAAAKLNAKISAALAAQFSFEVPVILRTAAELDQLVRRNPYTGQRNVDVSKLHVVFLPEMPPEAVLKSLTPPAGSVDEYHIDQREIFLHCPGGYGKTKLSNNFFERKLAMHATTRNWKTVNVLNQMAQDLNR